MDYFTPVKISPSNHELLVGKEEGELEQKYLCLWWFSIRFFSSHFWMIWCARRKKNPYRPFHPPLRSIKSQSIDWRFNKFSSIMFYKLMFMYGRKICALWLASHLPLLLPKHQIFFTLDTVKINRAIIPKSPLWFCFTLWTKEFYEILV